MGTVSADSVAQDQIRAFVERIMRLREEERAIKGDIREIYAEAKSNGFDKTVLGKLVNYVEKRNTGAADLQEAEALFDLYLSAYDGAVGTVRATHTHEATSSTAARKDVRSSPTVAPTGEAVGAGTQAPPVDTNSTPDCPIGEEAGEAETGETLSASAAPIPEPAGFHTSDPLRSDAATRKDADTPAQDTHSEPAPGASPVEAVSDEGGAPSVSLVAANSDAPVSADRTKPHPWCRDPEECGLSSWDHFCLRCQRVKAERQAVEAVQ